MARMLHIFGVSVRAAAASAVRAGYAVSAVDHFADCDTRAIASCQRIADYPADFERAADKLPTGPWMYTGGLENYPELIDAIAASRPLWGNAGRVLRAVRDPRAWTQALARAQLPTLAVSRIACEVPRDGSWLAKPLRSGGGVGIRVVEPQTLLSDEPDDNIYFQQRASGEPASLVFVAARGKAQLLGATRQLCGAAWAGAPPLVYAGSFGPLSLPPAVGSAAMCSGDVLAAAFDLVGLFGVDGVLNDAGFWPVEINPRYTASIEILERASGTHFVQFHADACEHGVLPEFPPSPSIPSFAFGKAILYAERAALFGPAAAEWVARVNGSNQWPVVADIPQLGERISAGQPVATVFADAASDREMLALLQERIAELRSRLD